MITKEYFMSMAKHIFLQRIFGQIRQILDVPLFTFHNRQHQLLTDSVECAIMMVNSLNQAI